MSRGIVLGRRVLGNLAASLVVRQLGTATTTPDEMKEVLRSLLEEVSGT